MYIYYLVEAVRRIVSLCDLVRKTVQNLLQQIGQGKSEAAYTVEMLTDRFPCDE